MNHQPPCLFLPELHTFPLWRGAHPAAPTAAGDSQGCVQGSRLFPRHCCLAHSQLVFCKIHIAGTIHITPQSPSHSRTDTCSDHLKTPPHHRVWEAWKSEGSCYRTGLAFIQSLHREQVCSGSEGVTHGGYKNQVTWSRVQHTRSVPTFNRTVNEMTWTRTLSQDPSQETAHRDSPQVHQMPETASGNISQHLHFAHSPSI